MKRNTPLHPKLLKLAAELKIRKYAAVGLLELLWHFTARSAPQGDVGRFQDTDISFQLDWRGNPNNLISALVKCGWLDRDRKYRLIIHHWSTHSDDTCDKYLSDSGRLYADGNPPRRKGKRRDKDAAKSRQVPTKSRQVATKSR